MFTNDNDRPSAFDAELGIEAGVNPAEILARYWNDRVPARENIETITWWLRQTGDVDTAC